MQLFYHLIMELRIILFSLPVVYDVLMICSITRGQKYNCKADVLLLLLFSCIYAYSPEDY